MCEQTLDGARVVQLANGTSRTPISTPHPSRAAHKRNLFLGLV